MTTKKYDNPMSRQVFSLPELIEQQYEDLEPKARKVLSFQEIFNIQRIVLTGAGDSYAAAMATRDVFTELTGLPVEVVSAIDLARFYPSNQLGYDVQNPLVVTVSNSGSGARVSEAVQRAKKHGCFVLGVTGNAESDLAKYSDKILDLDIPSFEDAPGTRSYLVSVMALLLLAIRFGEVLGKYTMDLAMDYRFDVKDHGKLLEESLSTIDEKAIVVADKWKDLPAYDFIGSGSDYAAAWFGQAKFLEANGKIVMHINTEEWLHLNFFAQNPNQIGTFVVASMDNKGLSRNKEVIKYAKELGRPLTVITDGDETDFENDAATYITVPKGKYAFNNILINYAPLALIASYIGEANDEKYGRGVVGPWAFADGGYAVKNSEIIVD